MTSQWPVVTIDQVSIASGCDSISDLLQEKQVYRSALPLLGLQYQAATQFTHRVVHQLQPQASATDSAWSMATSLTTLARTDETSSRESLTLSISLACCADWPPEVAKYLSANASTVDCRIKGS